MRRVLHFHRNVTFHYAQVDSPPEGTMFKRLPETSSFVQLLKYSLAVLYTFVIVGGCAVLGIGIWTLVTEYGGKQLSDMIGVHLYLIDSYLLIVCGCSILVVTMLGCCGVIFEYKCLLSLHLFIMGFIAAMLIVGGALGFAFRNELEDSVRIRLETSVTQKYGLKGHEFLTDAWDSAQSKFECCGAHGDLNSTTSWALYQESYWYLRQHKPNMSFVPESCCMADYIEYCQDTHMEDIIYMSPPELLFSDMNVTIYTEGCFEQMIEALEANGLVIGTAAIIVAIFILIDMILSICLYRHIRG